MRRNRSDLSASKLPKSFFAYILMSFALIVLIKVISGNLRQSAVKHNPEENIRIIADALTKYAIENDNRLPKRLSALYPKYCDNLMTYNPQGSERIQNPEEIDAKSFFKLNPGLPDTLDDIHIPNSLIVLEDKSPKAGTAPLLVINGNFDVIPFTKQSAILFGLTYKNKIFEKEGIDENGDGRIDEETYSYEGQIVYSIKKTYNNDGRLIRETWYDAKGEITSDYGPAFRMYNYDAKGRLVMITNHYAKGEPAECFGVAKILYKYDSNGITEYYFNKDGSLITTNALTK